MKKQLIRAAAATVLGLSLTAGFASADTISQNGRDSSNTTKTTTTNTSTVTNRNNLGVLNGNRQQASSGQASSHDTVYGGGASTGSATNGNASGTNVSVSNGASTNGAGAAMGTWASQPSSTTISDNLRGSTNSATTTTTNSMTVNNTNNVEVDNVNLQSAHSGKATVKDTVYGGNATTGAASNSSQTNTSVSVNN